MDYWKQYLEIKRFFEERGLVMEHTDHPSTDEQELRKIQKTIEAFRHDGTDRLAFYFGENTEDQNKLSFSFTLEGTLGVSIMYHFMSRGGQQHRSWEDFDWLERVIENCKQKRLQKEEEW